MRAVTISLLAFLLVISVSATGVTFCDAKSDVLCIEIERKALLKFKHDLIDRSNRLSSWVDGDQEDCCKWVGVVCNNRTGHVYKLQLGLLASFPDQDATNAERDAFFRSRLGGKINPSLLDLKHLSFLDLSKNHFGGTQIPKFIGSLKSLTYLNLSWANFGGAMPHKLGNLSNLHHLDLGYNFGLKAKTLEWVSGLSSLQYLYLTYVDLSQATDWEQVTSKLPSLVELHLSSCALINGPSPASVNYTSLAVLNLYRNGFSSIPTWIFSLPCIVSLDLSSNDVVGMIPNGFQNMSSLKFLDLSGNLFSSSSIPSWLSSLNHLQFLNLGGTNLQGNISGAIANLSSVTHLDLSYNMLEGIAPKCLESLCNLREIDLSNNAVHHEVSEIIQSLSRCTLGSLESLEMEDNKLSGHLIDELGHFENLAQLSLGRNSISGPIPFSIGKLSSLKILDVSNNQFTGPLPQSLGKLENLEILKVSNNKLEGNVTEMHFSNITRLIVLWASNNMLKPNPSWIPPFSCRVIALGSWHLGPQFPHWLQFRKNLSNLDISNAGISGIIPTWFWNLSTQFNNLNLSHNQLSGGVPFLPESETIDLSYNQFNGPLPPRSQNLRYLFLSNNLFSGSLYHFLCNSTGAKLFILDIESNSFSDKIPDCWENWAYNLDVLNLGNNNLTGEIPRSFGSVTSITSLNLRNNSLVGEVPSALQHFAGLSILDLSENQFTGSIPAWMGDKLPSLVVLILRSNNFDGHIPDKICAPPSLQILDLASNNISGAIPKCLSNLSAMANRTHRPYVSEIGWTTYGWDGFSSVTYTAGALLVMRGRKDLYSTTLGLVTTIDLSANNLKGEIPKDLGNLKGLVSLNFSGNLLTGKIPENIGNMEVLESLDLSMNRFYGEIPSSFSSLNFLNHLNLSCNSLSGQIPSGTQLQSFDNISYIGNHLCGAPLTKSCNTKVVTPNVTNGGSDRGSEGPHVNGLYVSIVLGFVMGFWGVVAPVFFIRSWRIAYYQKLEDVGRRLYVFWARNL